MLGQGHVFIRLGTVEQFWGVMLKFSPPPAVYMSSGAPVQPGLCSLQPVGGTADSQCVTLPLLAASGVAQWACLLVM